LALKKIAIGSLNPVKTRAVENVINKVWPGAEIVCVNVPSGVSDQPISDEESIMGATNRARLALENTNADLGIGLEGGVNDSEHGMFLCSWCVALDKNGVKSVGCGGRLLLPEKIANELRKGKELGPVMDELLNDHNVKQKQGTVGILTNNLVTRTAAFERAVIYALTKFINSKNYE